MNREILFRGRRVDNGEWVEGYYLMGHEYDTYIAVVTDIPFSDFDFVPVTPATVGQYTGLTDKNGVKIFEGDTVKTNKYGKDAGAGHNSAGHDTFCVEFADGGYHLYNGRRRFNLRPDAGIEVIGSIRPGTSVAIGDIITQKETRPGQG